MLKLNLDNITWESGFNVSSSHNKIVLEIPNAGYEKFVFFNKVDKSEQKVNFDGNEIIIINPLNKEDTNLVLSSVKEAVGSFGKKLNDFSRDEFIELLHIKIQQAALNHNVSELDMYISNKDYLANHLSSIEDIDVGIGLYERIPEQCTAIYIKGNGSFINSDNVIQEFKDNAVIVKNRDTINLVNTEIFLKTYNAISDKLDYEFLEQHIAINETNETSVLGESAVSEF